MRTSTEIRLRHSSQIAIVFLLSSQIGLALYGGFYYLSLLCTLTGVVSLVLKEKRRKDRRFDRLGQWQLITDLCFLSLLVFQLSKVTQFLFDQNG
jgi:D-alanyl-lipoteichoic acid acyltransferase DltB (MBOAT superfamily)